jgi:hypothetical protein
VEAWRSVLVGVLTAQKFIFNFVHELHKNMVACLVVTKELVSRDTKSTIVPA